MCLYIQCRTKPVAQEERERRKAKESEAKRENKRRTEVGQVSKPK